MPPRKKSLVLGVAGIADAPEKDIKAQLDDLNEAEKIDSIVILLTDPLPESVLTVADWADEQKIDYLIVDDGTCEDRAARGLKRNASTDPYESSKDDAAKKLISLLDEEAPENTQARLLLLWDADVSADPDQWDGGAYDALEVSAAAGVPAFILNKGLEPLTLGDPEDSTPEPEPEPEAPKAEPAKRTRKPRQTKAEKEAEAAEAAAAAGGQEDEAQAQVIPLGALAGATVEADSISAALDVLIEAIADRTVAKLQEWAERGAAQETQSEEQSPREARRARR